LLICEPENPIAGSGIFGGEAIEENTNNRDGIILMADDDLDYHLIAKCALEEIGFRGVLQSVKNGKELLDYLYRRGKYRFSMTPDLIILDLNMPEKDGRSALREIKADPSLLRIPVAVITSSVSDMDIELCSRFRRCTYTTKPITFDEWIGTLEDILTAHLTSWNPAIPMLEEKSECCNPSE
jgi:CheY-like chemotaxis protein